VDIYKKSPVNIVIVGEGSPEGRSVLYTTYRPI